MCGTSASIIRLLEDNELKVVERDITLAELREGIEDGEIVEIFACGTAAIVTPVGRMASTDFEVTVGDGQPGAVTLAVRDRLMGVQYGRIADTYGWMERIHAG